MKQRRILFFGITALLVSFYFAFEINVPKTSAAVCILRNVTWMQANAKNGDQVKFKIDGQDCALDAVKVRVMLYQPILTDSEITTINLNFPRTGNKILGDWQVTISSVAVTNSKLYLIANLDSAGTGTKLDSRGASIPYLTVTPPLGQNPNVTITKFDLTPRKINANQITGLSAVFKAKVDTPAYLIARCSQIQASLINDSDNEIYTQNPQPVSGTDPNYSFDFRYNYNAKGDGTINLRGKLKCLSFGVQGFLVHLPISSSVCIAIGSGVCDDGGGGGGGGAPPPSGAVCGNNKCESGESQSSCPADCKPGSDQVYPFEIPNPLKGGASDFTSLVKIIAQWIFNLAIPIAVAMIVYSGILFLTAAGEPAKVTKARDVLKWAVVGLAIILIGSGFVTLIQSILELGGTAPTQDQGLGGLPGGGQQPPLSTGEKGSRCSGNRNCVSGLICGRTSICQRPTGNLSGEPCNAGASCDVGLACDATGENIQTIDGQRLGTCFQTSATGGRIGDVCQKDENCISGLKCNQICQRNGGNLSGEVCFNTSSSPNCKSNRCHTIGTSVAGVCE